MVIIHKSACPPHPSPTAKLEVKSHPDVNLMTECMLKVEQASISDIQTVIIDRSFGFLFSVTFGWMFIKCKCIPLIKEVPALV